MPDDRRSLTLRLKVLQYVVAAAFAALAIGFWIFQVAQHEKFREMAEENHLRRLPLPAPRGVLLDRDGNVLVDNQNSRNIALVREQTRNIDETLHIAGAGDQHRRGAAPGDRRAASPRPDLPADRPHRERHRGAVHRGDGATVGAARDLCAGSAVAEISSQRHGRASFRLRRRDPRGSVAASRLRRASSRAQLVGQAGIEFAYNRFLMGTDGSKTVVVNSVGREIGDARRQSRRTKAAACS